MNLKTVLAICLMSSFLFAMEDAEEERKFEGKPYIATGTIGTNDYVEKLDLSNARNLRDITFLHFFTRVTDLDLSHTLGIKDTYGTIACLPYLQKLNLTRVGITTTVHLRPLVNLTSVDLSGNPITTMAADLLCLPRLRRLYFAGFNHLTDITEIGQLTSLRKLNLCGAFNNDCAEEDEVEHPPLDFLSSLTRLIKLDLSSSDCIYNIKPIVRLPLLTHLDLSGCHCIQDLRYIRRLKAIVKLNLRSIDTLDISTLTKDLKGLTHLTTLRSLTVDSNQRIEEDGTLSYAVVLPPLSDLVLIHRN